MEEFPRTRAASCGSSKGGFAWESSGGGLADVVVLVFVSEGLLA